MFQTPQLQRGPARVAEQISHTCCAQSRRSRRPVLSHCQAGPAPASTACPEQQSLGARVEQALASVKGQGLGLLLAAALVTVPAGPTLAADAAKVGTCLLNKCQGALAGCIGDAECLESLVCLQLCNGRPDEAGCQIRCGDLYKDKAVETFNACAVSQGKCVPQKVDKDVYPIPPDSAVVPKFDLKDIEGRWYITAGHNELFDTFPCQEHFFAVPNPDSLAVRVNWRVPKGKDGDFIERSDLQTFKQDFNLPGHLHNGGNAFLNYEDDWFVVASKPEQYHFIYYQGNNDAWKGYGGAVVYTREASLPTEFIPELSKAAEKVGLKWSDFKITDNTCGPKPPAKTIREKTRRSIISAEQAVANFLGEEEKVVEKGLSNEAAQIRYEIEKDLAQVSGKFTVLERKLLTELQKDEQGIARVLSEEEKVVEEDIRNFVAAVEQRYKTVKDDNPLKAFLRFFRLPNFANVNSSA